MGIKDYLMYDGYSCRFTPIKNKMSSTDAGLVDALELYRKMKEDYSWEAMSAPGWFVDYQNMYSFLGVMSQRQLFLTVSNALVDAGEGEKALEIMDMCQEKFPKENFPLETISVGFTGNDYMVAQMVENYYYLGKAGNLDEDLAAKATASAKALAAEFGQQLLETCAFYLSWGRLGYSEFEAASQVLGYVADVCKQYGDEELSKDIEDRFNVLIMAALPAGEKLGD